ncbi:hypothetical protein [Vulgatibacter sp.]|uniref:hypothetical protein n=1 Tax=Vulgatibacter sp. TaxID=1971226 RepID=UPI00356A16C5
MPRLAGIALAIALAGCGVERDVRFVVETDGEARATELELRVDEETRFFEQVAHGDDIVERGVLEGTRVSLKARNGGDEGRVLLRAFVDDCEVAEQHCDGTACVSFVELTVDEGC